MSIRGSRDFGARERPARSNRVTMARPPSMRQRSVDATRALREALNLPPNMSDTHVLTALAEAAAEETRRNPQFAETVRSRAHEIAAQTASTAKPVRSAKSAPLPPLVPIRRIPDYHADPFNAPDPHFLVRLYGHDQLARALYDYTVDMLKETAAQLEREHPGTKPDNRGRRDALIAYIVEQTPAG